MAPSQIEVKPRVTELATQAFKAFCDYVSKSKSIKPSAKKASVKKTGVRDITEKAKAGKTRADKSASIQTPTAKKSKGKKTSFRKPKKSQQQKKASGEAKPAYGISIAENIFEKSAEDIMQNQVTWASPDDSLQQVLAKMHQIDAGYIMVGLNGVLEGIVSKSDITRAMSPFLQPILARWRRPLDDATLKIRIKWIMSRPVHTIKPETSLAAIMEYMGQFRGRCLVVTDENGNVQGLVTTFDIFRALL